MQATTSVKSHGLINCDGCGHSIPEDQPILSDIPEQIPEDFPRETFRHFHIHCHSCEANSIPCYQLYASRQVSFAAQANADCDRCGHPIHAGEDVLRDSFFRWNMTGDAGDKGVASGGLAGIGRAHKSIERVPRNILRERRHWNRSRGPANMKSWKKVRAHAMNGADATRIVGKNALVNERSGTIWGALMEAPVSAVEGAICVAKGKLSKEDAAKKAAMNTAKSSAVAGTTAFGFTVADSLGAAPVLVATSSVVVSLGMAIYGVSTIQRIQAAIQDPDPLPSVPFYFHTGCWDCGTGLNCFEKFAAEVSRQPLQ